jgi:hypothetical protein
MSSNRAKPARFDTLQIDLFKKTIESEAFRRIWLRIGVEQARAVARCAREDTDIEFRRAQGAQAALASVLALPEQILAEMRAGKQARGE